MAARMQAGTFVDVAAPRARGVLWDAALVVGAGTLLALFARIAIPLPGTPVPVTGQTLGVLLIGALLGSRRGALAMLAYLAEGLAGLPVFAAGTSAWSAGQLGLPIIVGPTAGYLAAFPIVALLVGWLAERGWDRRFGTAVMAMLAGEALLYLIALPWLGHFVGLAQVITLGMAPFLPGDLLKVAVAAAVLPSGWRALGRLATWP